MASATQEEQAVVSAIAPWFGGKRIMAARIARECCQPDGRPPKSFWDLCCGSLAVSIAMPQVSHHHAVDLHDDLVNLARVIQDRKVGPVFYRRLRRVMCHEVLFADSKTAIENDDRAKAAGFGLFGSDAHQRSLDPLERAIAYFIISWQGRNGVAGTERVNYQPAIRWTSGGGHGGVRVRNAVASIPAWRRRLRSISVLQRDIFEVVPKIEDQEGTSIYVDPPYVRAGGRSGSCTYEHEFTSNDHQHLCDAVARFQHARVVISYYDHPVLREMYRDWNFVVCPAQKMLSVQNRRGGERTAAAEILIINGRTYEGVEE